MTAAETKTGEAVRLVVVVPVFNDWEGLRTLLADLAENVPDSCGPFTVLAVNDGSTEDPAGALKPGSLPPGIELRLLHLARNLGHQRAIAVGLAYTHAEIECTHAVIMDADGQDRPADVPRLLDKCHEKEERMVVFAKRKRRKESALFSLSYRVYQLLAYALTGEYPTVGNFSVVPKAFLAQIVTIGDLWNHYAASVFFSRIPHTSIPTERERRRTGETRMNWTALVEHGFEAIAVASSRVGVHLLTASSLLAAVWLGGGWAAVWAGFMPLHNWAAVSLILLSLVLVMLCLTVRMHGERNRATFLPIRDYVHFVRRVETLRPDD